MINAYHLKALSDSDWWSVLKRRSLEQDAILEAIAKREAEPTFDPAAFRKAIIEQAPYDLAAIGVPTPFLHWQAMVDETRRQEAMAIARTEIAAQVGVLRGLAVESWLSRKSPFQPWRSLDGCAAIRVDLEPVDLREAELRAGFTLASLRKRLDDLDRRERRGEWP
jgi:hypothetical protein